jgi:hypothetical protein
MPTRASACVAARRYAAGFTLLRRARHAQIVSII